MNTARKYNFFYRKVPDESGLVGEIKEINFTNLRILGFVSTPEINKILSGEIIETDDGFYVWAEMKAQYKNQVFNELNDKKIEDIRFEVISPAGRLVVRYGVDIEFSVQDDNKTLKIFLKD